MLDNLIPAGAPLGLEIPGSAYFSFDLLLAVSLAAILVRDFAPADRKWRLRLLDFGLSLLAVIVISGLVLGLAGELHSTGFVTLHSILLACMVLRSESKQLTNDRLHALFCAISALKKAIFYPFRRIVSPQAWRGEERLISLLFLGGIGVLVWFLIPALFAYPANHDSNTYRLARIGYWLQENRIGHFPTNDPRMNFIGFNTEVVMAWICCFFQSGYPLAGLAQYGLGTLMLCATYSISIRLGLSRMAAIAAMVITLGIPPIALQFFTSQTDLFTAGALCISIAYYLEALHTRQRWDWGMFGIAAGTAIGAKGTVLYWIPGLGCAGLLWALRERLRLQELLGGLSLAALLTLPLGTPAFLLNMLDYGKPFAPDSMIEYQHKHPLYGRLDFIRGNMAAYSWQMTDPASNFPFAYLVRPLHEKCEEKVLAGHEHYSGFRSIFEQFARTPHQQPHEDIASYGVLIPFLGVAACGMLLLQLLRRRWAGPLEIGGIAAALCLFILVFGVLESWTPFKFRYFVILGPFLAILVTHCFRGTGFIPKASLFAIGTLQLSAAAYYGYASQIHGWCTILGTRKCPYTAQLDQPTRIMELVGSQPRKIAVCVRFGAFTAQFLRTGIPHSVQFLPAASISNCSTNREVLHRFGADYLIVSAEYLKTDREGVVVTSPWGPDGPYSLVRQSTAAELQTRSIQPIQGIYPDRWTAEHFQIVVRNWGTQNAVLKFKNPTGVHRVLELSTSVHRERFDFAPAKTIVVAIPIAPYDTISGSVYPPFIPAEGSSSSDTRHLGLVLELPNP